MKEISFVMAVLNGGNYLVKTFEAIKNQDYDPSKFEIVVADGGSTDGTLDVCKQYGAKVIHTPLLLGEPGLRLGIKACNSRYLCIMACDVELGAKDWTTQTLSILKETNADVVFCRHESSPDDTNLSKYHNFLIYHS